MRLYRGDSLPREVAAANSRIRGRTFADHFIGNGLMAKFADGGTSELLLGKSLLQLVLEHVGYESGTPAERLSDHSPFISFSMSEACAFAFSERKEKKRLRLQPCHLDEATHFVWELEIDMERDVKKVKPGQFDLEYSANPTNCSSFIEEELRRGIQKEVTTHDPWALACALGKYIACRHATADSSIHRAVLVDVVSFVCEQDTSTFDNQLVRNTIERATRDHEWLIYPADLMPNGQGVSARFTMNRHLGVYGCFREASWLDTP